MEIIEESATNKQSFPQGVLISSRLPSNSVGNLLEVHDFLCSFKEVIGMEDPISFEELEQELLCPCPLRVGKSSILDTFETFVHSLLLPELVSKLLDRLASVVNAKLGVKIQLGMLPINELTWPEVARRYIMAYLLMGGKHGSLKITDSNKSALIHCLQSDCGIFSSSPTNVARIDLDAQLLKRAVNNVFGKLKSVRNTLSIGLNGDESDGSIPQWAKVLDPVKKLPINVGSRIRNCVHEALKHSPPEWAKKLLEASISEEVYKGNTSGINLKKSHVITPSLAKLVDDMSKDFNLKYENEVAPLLRKLSEYNMDGNFTAEVELELQELLASIDIPKMSLEAGICKVCGINQDDDKVLLCDTEWWNAEYHTYCLNPPLSEIPKGNWYCPECMQQADDQPKGIQILEFVDKSLCEEASPFLDILTALEETEYWELEAHKKIFLLKFLVDMSLDTSLIRKNAAEFKRKLTKKFLGIDSVGRIYWGFPNVSTRSGIVIYGLENTEIDPFDHLTSHSQYNNCGQWYLFQSEKEISKLVGYLTVNDPCNKLRESILLWQKTMLQNGQQTGRNKPMGRETDCSKHLNKCPHNCLTTNATVLIEAQYGSCMKSDATKCAKKPRGNMAKWHRCDCLEPIFPSRYHCVKCHETFFTNVEFEHHKNSTCEVKLDFGRDCLTQVGLHRLLENSDRSHEVGNSFTVPESSSKPLLENTHHILRQLMMNLLDMEAALPDGAKRRSMESPEWRSGWCAFVKSATTIREIIEATLALGTMIKSEYINNTWWWYWSSVTVAANTSTTAALALRIYTLDAAIKY